MDDKLSAPLKRVGVNLNQLQTGLGQMGKGIGQVSSGLMRIGTIAATAAVGGLAAVVTTAASFEQAFTGVEKTVDETANVTLPELEQTLRQMARTMPVAFEELAAIGEAGGALGVGIESLDEFIDVVARLAVSTDLDAESAATALGQLGTVLHLTGQEYEDFADTLVALGNAGASTESQIVEIAARFGAAGNAAGLSKEEILALSSAVASMGIEVEAGGSSLSRLFNQTTTNIGVGSGKAKAFAKALGLTFDEFKKAWDTDALGTFDDLLNHLNDLDKFQAAALLKSIGVTGVRDINAIGLMAQNVGFVADQLDVARTAQGALGEESGKFFATTQGQWIILKNNVRDAAATIGTELLPVTNELITDFVDELNKPGTQIMLKNLGKDIAAGIKSLVAELKGTDFSGIIGGLKLAAEVAKGAFDAFRALPEPIQQLAIAALVANKVSGGAVGMIAKGLGNLVLGSLKTIMATNVTVIGGSVTGGGAGAPVVGGAGLVISAFLGVASAVVLGRYIGEAIGKEVFYGPTVDPARTYEKDQVERILNEPGDVARRDAQIARIDEGIADLRLTQLIPPLGPLGGLNPAPGVIEQEIALLQEQRDALVALRDTARRTETETARWTGMFGAEIAKRKEAENRLQALLAPLPFGIGQLVAKNWNPTLNVRVDTTTNISVSNVARALTSLHIAGQGSIGGRLESDY